MSKYIDNFREEVNKIISSPLMEQARTLDDAERDITSLGDKISEHLLRVLMFGPNCIDCIHWTNEINTWLLTIKNIKLKLNNKPVKTKYLLQWMTERLTDRVGNWSQEWYEDLLQCAETAEKNYIPVAENLLKNNFEAFKNLYTSLIKAIGDDQNYNRNMLDTAINSWFNQFSDVYK